MSAMPFSHILLVASGGALGAVARYAAAVAIGQFGPAQSLLARGVPLATFGVNILGALAIGVLAALLVADRPDHVGWRLFLVVGVLGGFTTFSAFALDMFTLLERREFALLGFYAFGSVGLGFLAFCIGYAAARGLMGGSG